MFVGDRSLARSEHVGGAFEVSGAVRSDQGEKPDDGLGNRLGDAWKHADESRAAGDDSVVAEATTAGLFRSHRGPSRASPNFGPEDGAAVVRMSGHDRLAGGLLDPSPADAVALWTTA